MRHLLISPGSRSAPLAYAAAALSQQGVLKVHVRIDERSAAFTALGLAKALGQPVGLVTTSGTAVGQALPALMEAYHSGAPLALLSADRPSALQGTGANQTTRQAHLAPSHTRASIQLENYRPDLADPQVQQLNLALAALTGRDPKNWQQLADQPQGPVQINLALDLPLSPQPQDWQLLRRWAQALADSLPPLDGPLEAPAGPQADLMAADWLAQPLKAQPSSQPLKAQSLQAQAQQGPLGLVLAGDGAGPQAQAFAQKLGLPLLAEPSSGARFSSQAIEAYRQILATDLGQQVEKVAVFGHLTLSRPVAALLADSSVPKALYRPTPAPWYEPGALNWYEASSLDELAAWMLEPPSPGQPRQALSPQDWFQAWKERGQQLEGELLAQIKAYQAGQRPLASAADRTAGMALSLRAWQASLADGAVLLLGSSNLIRDLDLIAPSASASPQVFANRGLAGIDGTLATAAGLSLALGKKVRVLLGDLTFLHDLSSLNIGPLEEKPDVEVWVYDDRGGGIFATLEHGALAADPELGPLIERFFTTPHSAQLEQLASGWGENGYRVQVFRPQDLG